MKHPHVEQRRVATRNACDLHSSNSHRVIGLTTKFGFHSCVHIHKSRYLLSLYADLLPLISVSIAMLSTNCTIRLSSTHSSVPRSTYPISNFSSFNFNSFLHFTHADTTHGAAYEWLHTASHNCDPPTVTCNLLRAFAWLRKGLPDLFIFLQNKIHISRWDAVNFALCIPSFQTK